MDSKWVRAAGALASWAKGDFEVLLEKVQVWAK